MRATAYALALYALAAVAPNEVLAGGSSPIVLTDQNWDQELGSYEYVLVAFGASWCPYSRQLESTWNSAAVTYNGDTRIAFARIDCEENKSTCRNNNIMKYPTIKLYHNKQARPNEYRGSRTVAGFKSFIDMETKPAVGTVATREDIDNLGKKFGDKSIVAYFSADNANEVAMFNRLSEQLRHFCSFHKAADFRLISNVPAPRLFQFRTRGEAPQMFPEDPAMPLDDGKLLGWATSLCRPLVQHLTFENSEAITEEGKPLVVLFVKADDQYSQDLYKRKIEEHLKDESRVKFVIADGTQFEHPLAHISKTLNDLPVIAVDSFQHIYDFGPFHGINELGKMARFIDDIFNDQLHHRFHHGNPLASTCMWRQTASCRSNGEREVHADAPCTEQIIPGRSGFCECGAEYGGMVLYFDCGHDLMTCNQVCAKAAAEDSRRAALAQCMWRQTANCNPDGAREAAYDKDCLTQIPNGVSGYCDCYPGGPRIKFICEHQDIVCIDICMEYMIKSGVRPDSTIGQGQAGEDPAQMAGRLNQADLQQHGQQVKQAERYKRSETNPSGESILDKLRPSERRYSILKRDEL